MILLDWILLYFKKRKINKLICCPTGDCQFIRSSSVNLKDGSKPQDIVISSNVWMFGKICSQSGGKVYMGRYSKIGQGSSINCVDSIEIGENTAIARNVTITDNNNHPVSPLFRLYMRHQSESDDSRLWKHSDHKPIKIGSNVWIGENVRIQKGVVIGDNSVIAANSIVTKSVPSNCIAAGNPAKIVKDNIDLLEPPTTCLGFNEWRKKQ